MRYLHTMIRQIDSSLLDEWEKLRDPGHQPAMPTRELRPPGAEQAAHDITRDTKAFTAAIRNRIFTFLRALAIADYQSTLEILADLGRAEPPLGQDAQPVPTGPNRETWTAKRFTELMEQYHVDHEHLCLDPEARNIRHTYVSPSEDKKTWRVQQMLVDPDGHNDWVAEFNVDLAKSRNAEEPVLTLIRLGSLT